MADITDSPPDFQALPPAAREKLETLYYGLVIVSVAAALLFIYNLIILRWCVDHERPSRVLVRHDSRPITRQTSHIKFVNSYKHKKDGVVTEDEGNEYECAVCLSVFEEGEHLWQLPNCKHNFHAICIDTWLQSHTDCPLCRTPLKPTQDVVGVNSCADLSNHEALV